MTAQAVNMLLAWACEHAPTEQYEFSQWYEKELQDWKERDVTINQSLMYQILEEWEKQKRAKAR